MTEKISLSLGVAIKNGPQLTLIRTIEVDIYDKIDVSIADGVVKDVELLPDLPSNVKFFLVVSDHYETSGLSYTINTGGTDYNLDQPHILTGEGAIKLMDATPQKLVFTNQSGKDAQIGILIGRNI